DFGRRRRRARRSFVSGAVSEGVAAEASPDPTADPRPEPTAEPTREAEAGPIPWAEAEPSPGGGPARGRGCSETTPCAVQSSFGGRTTAEHPRCEQKPSAPARRSR